MILSWCWKVVFVSVVKGMSFQKLGRSRLLQSNTQGAQNCCRYICWSSPSSPRWGRSIQKVENPWSVCQVLFLSCTVMNHVDWSLLVVNWFSTFQCFRPLRRRSLERRPKTPAQEVQNALQSANEWSPPPPPAKSNQYKAYRPTGPTIFAFIDSSSLSPSVHWSFPHLPNYWYNI